MSVYYIHSPDTGLVKIGFAQNPQPRLVKMQVDSPTRLILLAVEPGARATEDERHKQFAELRVRGEWFRYEAPLPGFIATLEPYQRPIKTWRKPGGPLGAWLRKNNHTLESFAIIAGTTQPTVSRICAGKQFPRRDVILRIIEATNWEVDLYGVLGIDRPVQPDAAAAA